MSRKSCLAVLAIVLAGCAAVSVDLPAISETQTNSHDVGRVVWRDLLTTTPAETQKFYSELFGWTFERPAIDVGFGNGDGYLVIRHNGRLIGGMFDARDLESEGNVSQWITFLSVDDVDAVVAKATAGGGSVVTPPTLLATRGAVAVLRDPEDALFAIVDARDGDPVDMVPEQNDFLWEELWTSDVEQSTKFYADLFGFEMANVDAPTGDRAYQVLSSGGQARAGILANPFEGEKALWANYLRVEDPAAVTARVDSLGGRVILDARKRPIGGTVALIAGPSGAGIALQTWPLDEKSGE